LPPAIFFFVLSQPHSLAVNLSTFGSVSRIGSLWIGFVSFGSGEVVPVHLHLLCSFHEAAVFLLPLAAAATNGRPVPPHQQQQQQQHLAQQQHVAHSCNTSAAGLSELPPTAAGDLVRLSVCHQAFPFTKG